MKISVTEATHSIVEKIHKIKRRKKNHENYYITDKISSKQI